ncbi:TPA: hypothetical protein ACH3X1_016242 [Trebouxia sp. C0004]
MPNAGQEWAAVVPGQPWSFVALREILRPADAPRCGRPHARGRSAAQRPPSAPVQPPQPRKRGKSAARALRNDDKSGDGLASTYQASGEKPARPI